MVKTTASRSRPTRSSSRSVRSKSLSKPTSPGGPAGVKAKSTARKARSTKASVSDASNSRVATSSASTRSRAAASSPVTAKKPRAPIHVEPTLASRRSRRGTAIPAPAEPQPSRNVSSIISAAPSFAQPTRKRKADTVEVEVVIPRTKRHRAAKGNELQLADAPSLTERLKVDEEALQRRELDLKKREGVLEKKERNLAKREGRNTEKLKRLETDKAVTALKLKELEGEVKALTATNATLEKKFHEKNAEVSTSPISSGNGVGVQWVLTQLEEQFQCSLCFEVMACPYQLNHGLCGHAFCALCLLQWCFAAVHRGCGYWHDVLECPLCRAELPCTPDTIPRQMCTFPFVPCRLADSTIKMLLGILKDAVDIDASARDACTGSSSTMDEKVSAWGPNGNAKVEWEARDAQVSSPTLLYLSPADHLRLIILHRRGRAEMAMLANNWANLQGEEFVAFKDRLDSQ